MTARIAVLASGGGTNLQAILDYLAARGHKRAGDVVLVASDNSSAGALDRARRADVPAAVLKSGRVERAGQGPDLRIGRDDGHKGPEAITQSSLQVTARRECLQGRGRLLLQHVGDHRGDEVIARLEGVMQAGQ